MKFKLNPKTDINNTALYKRLDIPDLGAQLVRCFGMAPEAIDEDPDSGYGLQYRFEATNHQPVTLYTRWDVWRIGALNPETADKFELWLCSQLGS